MNGLNSYGRIKSWVKGIVKDIDDPKKMLRIKVTIPELLMKGSEMTPWALPCIPMRRDWLPKVNDLVWIKFVDGLPSKPVWLGRAVAKDKVSQDFQDNYKDIYQIDYDENGNKIEWTENGFIATDGGGNITTSYFDKNNSDNNYISHKDSHGNEYKSDKDGIIGKDKNNNEYKSDNDGIKITDKNGNYVELKGILVNINGDTKTLVTFADLQTALNTFIIALNTHTHSGVQAGGSNTGTPTPVTLDIASSETQKIKTG